LHGRSDRRKTIVLSIIFILLSRLLTNYSFSQNKRHLLEAFSARTSAGLLALLTCPHRMQCQCQTARTMAPKFILFRMSFIAQSIPG
jgi:hypothetical protein